MRYCLALDLKNDPALIAEYERYHQQIWPDIEASIRESGITGMEIYRTGNRLFMIMDTDDTFSFARKAESDAASPVVQEWETLMWTYQQALPNALPGEASPGEKWRLMNKLFTL